MQGINIRLYIEEDNSFSIHPGEHLTRRITEILLKNDAYKVTNSLDRAIGHSTGSSFDLFTSRETKWTGLINGYIIKDSATIEDLAEELASEFNATLYTIQENKEYVISDGSVSE